MPSLRVNPTGMASRRCEEFQAGIGIESLLGSDTKKLLFRSSVVDCRPAQKDDRAAQNAVVACAPGLLNNHSMSHMGQKPHLRCAGASRRMTPDHWPRYAPRCSCHLLKRNLRAHGVDIVVRADICIGRCELGDVAVDPIEHEADIAIHVPICAHGGVAQFTTSTFRSLRFIWL
jgi:hypothetical protein